VEETDDNIYMAPWWKYQRSLPNDGYSTISSAPNTKTLQWDFWDNGFVSPSSPVVYNNKVYKTSGGMDIYGNYNRKIFALDYTVLSPPKLVWMHQIEEEKCEYIESTPAAADGLIVVGTELNSGTGYVVALDSEGDPVFQTTTEIWSTAVDGWVRASPTIYKGVVYVGVYHPGFTDSKVYALDQETGNIIWTFETETGTYFETTPAVGSDMVFIADSQKLYALPTEDSSGNGIIDSSEVIWRFSVPIDGSSPTVSMPLSRVFIGSTNGNVYALPINEPSGNKIIDPGEIIWIFPTGKIIKSSPAVDGSSVYIGADDYPYQSPSYGFVYSLDAVGNPSMQTTTQNWRYDPGGPFSTWVSRSSPSVADGKVYITCGEDLHALATSDGGLLWQEQISWGSGSEHGTNPAIADGFVFCANRDLGWIFPPLVPILYAFRDTPYP
jgi:hypothetical protein